jgi:hypothetical protein
MGALYFQGIHLQGYVVAILLGKSSFLIKSILAPFHLGNPHHLLSGLAWDSFTISFKFSSCKKSSILGVQEPSLGGRRDPKSPFFWCFLFTNTILSIGDMSLVCFLFLCPYAQ